MDGNRYNASWWTKEHDSSWEKVKAAFRRDWDQTKHDFGGDKPDLNQDVPDTVKQAAGKQSIPPPNTPNFEADEPAFRFGHGARQHYSSDYPKWDSSLESKLRNDWSKAADEATWNRTRDAIRRGYDYDS